MKIIAEIGSNQKGLLDCTRSIKWAKACGADIVKFQAYTSRELYGPDTEKENHLTIDLASLKAGADFYGIEIMCTAFSPQGYESVNSFVKTHKVASSEITDLDIISTVNYFKKPVILSTGGATLDEINTAVQMLRDCPVTLLYCVVAYPARVVDFRHLTIIKETFPQCEIGYSDHSIDVLNIPTMARDLGSTVLEKHVNFTDHTDTPDAPHSLNGLEFKMMCRHLKGDLSPELTFVDNPHKRVKTKAGYFRPEA